MRQTSAAVLVVLLPVIFSGCGGGGGGGHHVSPGSVSTEQAYLPLSVGNRWVYEYRAPEIDTQNGGPPLPDHSTRTVIGRTVINDQEWFEIEMIEWAEETGEDHPVEVLHNWFRETQDGVYLWHTTLHKPILWLKKPPEQGLEWTGLGPLGEGYTRTIERTDETLEIPYGTVDGCVRVVELEPTGESSPPAKWIRWFKKGIGLVADQYWGRYDDPQGPWDETVLVECTVH